MLSPLIEEVRSRRVKIALKVGNLGVAEVQVIMVK
jgi:hypothetical protein